MRFDPPVESGNDTTERPAELRQFIIDARRHLVIAGAPDEAVLFEPTQRLDKHFLGNAGHAPPQLALTAHALAQRVDHEGSPFLRQQRQHAAGRAIDEKHIALLGSERFGYAYLRVGT